MGDEIDEDAPLTAEEILTFGPCVEAQVWTPVWLQEARAPIAVAAGRPKFGKVFNAEGVGKAVVIRPCMSRGARIRGLPPIYTPQMLEKHADVFNGWPMFLDHAPQAVQEALAKRGRSVKDLGGQLLTGTWNGQYVHEDDKTYGYQKGAVIADIWARPLVREMVSENANLLHTSINAWPTSGKPGAPPWRPGVKGMIIEGIRRQPQGSVDFVVRGGAGGRLLVAEGLEDEGAWPEIGEWSEQDTRLVVSLAESLYASRHMADELTLPTQPTELRAWLTEHAAHLLPALAESSPAPSAGGGEGGSNGSVGVSLTEEDVRRILQEQSSGVPTVEEFEQSLREQMQTTLAERDAQRGLSGIADRLIESAVGIPPKWKADLKTRYAMLPSGPPSTLLLESADLQAEDGKTLTPAQVVEARVTADLEHVRDLLSEATGKPRVRGEGGSKPDTGESAPQTRPANSHWRKSFVELGLAESEDTALSAFGIDVKTEKAEG